MIKILILVFTVVPLFIKAQVQLEWVRIYDGGFEDGLRGLAVDGSGNAYVTGFSNDPFSNVDWTTVKYNSSGDSQWVRIYDGSGSDSDIPNSMSMDGSGNVYIAGTSNSKMTVLKYNTSGNMNWFQQYTASGNLGGFATGVTTFGSGIVYMVGATHEANTSYDCRIIKYNSLGTKQWTQTYHGAEELDDNFNAVVTDAAGNIYATGYSYEGLPSDYNYLTIKYSPNADELWVKKYDANSRFDFATAIAVDNSGNSYVTGASQGLGSNYDIVTVKYNQAGVQQWVRNFIGPAAPTAVITDDSGNVIITGSWNAFTEGRNFVTIKYSADGIQKWAQSYNGPNNSQDFSTSIASDILGNIYIGGYSAGNGSEYDIVTIKYSASGEQKWIRTYTGTENNSNTQVYVKLDTENNVYVSGTSANDYVTIKYSQTVGVSSNSSQTPDKFSLEQNYPNPFNPETVIRYSLIENGLVTLKVYDILGNEVATLVNEKQNPGTYNYQLSIVNYQLSSGIYYYKLEAGNFREVRKMILLK